MTALSIQPTYPIFTDIDGQPLDSGYVYIGQANLDPQGNPINVYWDAALTQLAAQPIRTLNGYPSNSGTPARLYVGSDYSIRVMNKKASTVYNAPEATERFSAVVVGGIDSSEVSYNPAGTGAVATTVQSKLRSIAVSVINYGADPTGVAASDTAFANAIAASSDVFVPPGTYKITTPISVPQSQKITGAAVDGANQSVLNFAPAVAGTSVFIFNGSDNVLVSRLKVQGPGQTTGTLESAFDLFSNQGIERQVVFDNITITGFNRSGIFLGGQWHVTVRNSTIQNCGNTTTNPADTGGIVFKEDGQLPNWSGSGNVLQDLYISGCSYGVYGGSAWNVSLINCIFEYNTYPYLRNAGGNFWTEINCWYENNTNPEQITGAMLRIGGRGASASGQNVTYGDIGITNIGEAGISMYRGSTPTTRLNPRDGFTKLTALRSSAGFSVDDPLYKVSTSEVDATPIRDITLQASGAIRGRKRRGTNLEPLVSLEGYSGYWTPDFPETVGATSSFKYLTARVGVIGYGTGAGLGSGVGAVGVWTGSHDNATNNTFALRWLFDYDGKLLPQSDNAYDIGAASYRARTIYAGTGTINTSDQNEKQQIEALEDSELQVAKKIKTLIRKFKFNDTVAEKGDGARIHVGVIAQDVEQAFIEAGLDPERYAMFCRDVWYEYDGRPVQVNANGKYVEEWYEVNGERVDFDSLADVTDDAVKRVVAHDTIRRERLGVRYEELLSFIVAAL